MNVYVSHLSCLTHLRLSALNLDHNNLDRGGNLSLHSLAPSLVSLSLASNGLARLPDMFKQTFIRSGLLEVINAKHLNILVLTPH